jgi:hypothetical protein
MRNGGVRFTSKSGHAERQHRCPLSAISGRLQRQGATLLVCRPKTLASGLVSSLLVARLDMNKVWD